MARLITCGFETGDISELGTAVTNTNSTQTVVSSSPTPRAGSYCLKCTVTGSGTNFTYRTFTFPAAKTEVWIRFAVYMSVTGVGPSAGVVLAGLNDAIGGGQTCLVWETSTGNIVARQGNGTAGALVGTSSAPMSQNAWHVVEWRVQITSTTVGVVEVWLDGTRVINFSGDNTGTSTLNVLTLFLGHGANYTASGAAMFVGLDDIAVNDVSGSMNNARPGDGRVVLLSPTGAGSNSGLTRGGTDTGANWSQTSELPPSMTQYVFGATAALRDTYALGDLGITPASINCCEVVALAQNSDAGAGSLGLTVKSSSTTNEGTAQALGTSAAYLRQLYETDPATSAAWTASGVNALEAGVTVR